MNNLVIAQYLYLWWVYPVLPAVPAAVEHTAAGCLCAGWGWGRISTTSLSSSSPLSLSSPSSSSALSQSAVSAEASSCSCFCFLIFEFPLVFVLLSMISLRSLSSFSLTQVLMMPLIFWSRLCFWWFGSGPTVTSGAGDRGGAAASRSEL